MKKTPKIPMEKKGVKKNKTLITQVGDRVSFQS